MQAVERFQNGGVMRAAKMLSFWRCYAGGKLHTMLIWTSKNRMGKIISRKG